MNNAQKIRAKRGQRHVINAGLTSEAHWLKEEIRRRIARSLGYAHPEPFNGIRGLR